MTYKSLDILVQYGTAFNSNTIPTLRCQYMVAAMFAWHFETVWCIFPVGLVLYIPL